MRVLLPVSDNFDAKLIIDFVCNYRWLKGTEFNIFHVIGGSDNEEHEQTMEEDARQLVERVTKKLQAMVPYCRASSAVICGTPIYEILQRAQEWQANMIVMGYRAERIAHPFLAGSVSRAVTLQAPCSVAVIRPPQESIKQLGEAMPPELAERA
jgi:nucleotide-binding universal stress UspA family protein